MVVAIKILITLAILLLLSYPFIPAKGKLRPLFVASSLKYRAPENRLNAIFILLAIAEIVLVVVLFKLFDKLAAYLFSIPFIGGLLQGAVNNTGAQFDYVVFVIKLVVVNLAAIYAYVILKGFVKKVLIDFPVRVAEVGFWRALFGRKHKKKNAVPAGGDENSEDDEQKKKRRRLRIPFFEHTKLKDVEELDEREKELEKEKNTDSIDDKAKTDEAEKPERSKFSKWILSLFFEGDDFQYARGWVVRAKSILQLFIRLVELTYLLFFIVVLLSAFFKLPSGLYKFLIDVVRIGDWYLYPFLSILLLQEVCNVFDVPLLEIKAREEKKIEEDEVDDLKRNARIRKLLAEIKKRFDKEHYLRYYPETEPDDVPEYECTSVMYKSALDYIRNHMQHTSGHVVQSYMRFLDAVYNDDHTYFSASFYSEIGEYLIAYAYIRLLSGARQVFVVSDPLEKETLRTYISDRLMKMTGSSPMSTWRVYTADERLEQADILIASPEDFVNNDIVEEHPAFFEEVCNAIFIDADRLVSLDSYLCPVVATRLQNATEGRIRFIFLTLDLVKGFAEGSIPRFFCIDKVLSFSSAKENEAVSCVLWNKESKKHRLYNKSVQKHACLETIIAEQACDHEVDGVRLITQSALENAERKMLSLHNVEINNFYKDVVDVNYMIYSDDRCNLSAALYATTRFRGRKKSVVHIISKPYLLREYFMAKAISEDHINRSSFIQPRVTEHYERHRLSLVRLFCDTASETGILVADFERRVREIIIATKARKETVASAYCQTIINSDDLSELKLNDYVAYLVAGIYDDDIFSNEEQMARCAMNSKGHDAKNFYIVVDSTKYGELAAVSKRYIIFTKTKEVFGHLIDCNRRVEVRLNDEVIGKLDTFPSRVHLEYIEGQSVIFNNSEYEIDHIAEDGSAIYLRHENINIKNCLDTFILRHYNIDSVKTIGESAVLNNSQSILQEIRVTRATAALKATSFGFYSLTGDRQTIDFYRGVEGNLNYDNPKVREYSDARVLHVTLKSRNECTDGMRRLLAAVFNEFIKTLFPGAYHCVAIAPVLAEPTILEKNDKNGDPEDRIRKLYPFFNDPSSDYIEQDPNTIQLYIINDSKEDVGILDWFYDHSARYMQEFLANIYSYLYWLKQRQQPNRKHYIYFGGEKMPECYDLDGCCELLGELNLVLSDSGEVDIETAADEVIDEKLEYCSFCHKLMESGRYSFFDDHRLICAECFDIVTDKKRLEEIYLKVKNYIIENYPGVDVGNPAVDFDEVYDLTADQVLSENYYRIDFSTKTIYVEIDQPANNVAVSILRGLITFWQVDHELANHYSAAQLYFEELKYLRSIGEDMSADWIYNNIPDYVRSFLDEITEYVYGKTESTVEDQEEDQAEDQIEDEDGENDGTDADDKSGDGDDKTSRGANLTSFNFMRIKADELSANDWDGEDPDGDEFSDDLYDPNKIPRFFKRYLRGQHIDDGEAEDVLDAQEPSEEEAENEGEDVTDNADERDAIEDGKTVDDLKPNCPPPAEDDLDLDTSSGEGITDKNELKRLEKLRKQEEKLRKKEEAKRKREEKRRLAQEKWEQQMNALDEEEAKRKRMFGEIPEDTADNTEDKKEEPKEKKKSFFDRFKKKKKQDELDSENTDADDNNVGENEDEVPEDKNDPVPSDPDDVVDDDTEKSEQDGSDESADDTSKDTAEEDTDGESTPKDKKKKDKKDKDKSSKRGLFKRGKVSEGERILPHEEDEKTNPKIRVYNDLVRAAYNYSEEPISREGVSNAELDMIFTYIQHDYPELFWVYSYSYNPQIVMHKFRPRDANGNLDLKQIKAKHQELRRAAKFFTKGITRRTDPYKALLTIYRRVILNLDYDGIGLDAKIDKDTTKDDRLRSLHSALVNRKVVCAGYAVAMQYLLQSVGIVCGYVVSEDSPDGSSCHAFNILKLGKYCYYLDATWGDSSNTKNNQNSNKVSYKYFCTPYNDFVKASPGWDRFHMPRKEFYPNLEEFKYTNHEYYRYHKAYLKSYSESELIRIFAESAIRYEKNKDEMGDFVVSFRCTDGNVLKFFQQTLRSPGKLAGIVSAARDMAVKKNKKAAKLLERTFYMPMYDFDTGVAEVFFEAPPSKKDKKKN